MKVLMSILTLCFFVSTAIFASSAIEGTYKCKGFDKEKNKNYAGTIVLSKKSDKVFDLKLTYDTGEKSHGTALLANNMLIVGYQYMDNSKQINGVEYYAISKHDNKIVGEWVSLGSDKVGTETCVK